MRTRNFAHVFAIHDDDGVVRTLLSFRAPEDDRNALVASGHPFFSLGWGYNAVGMVLDEATDWDEVAELVTDSYCEVAPKKLVALVDRPPLDD